MPHYRSCLGLLLRLLLKYFKLLPKRKGSAAPPSAKLVCEERQKEFPKDLFTIKMYALQ